MTIFSLSSARTRAFRLLVVVLGLLLAVAALVSPAASVQASPALAAPTAIIIVDGTTCTLADAITAANTDTATGGCVAGSGADTIDLQTDVTLTSALPDIISELTINGNDHTIARDSAASNFRILFVNSGGNLTLNRATLANGIAQEYPLTGRPIGGGLLNYGTTTINDSIIRDNGAFTAGGGLANYHYATLTINNSTIRNNGPNGISYLGGAGILNWGGTVTINNSTVSNNSGGEAIRNWRIKDGSVADSFTTIRNSTISAVSGQRALDMLGGGNITVDSSTIVGQSTRSYEPLIVAAAGGTTPGNAAIVMRNSIAFDMGSGGAPVCLTSAVDGATATITSDGHNLVSDASCGFTATGDQQSVSAANLKLGPLADNGGPTQTYALLPGSVAIDAGDTTLTTDQRGEARPYGPADDIGAFELTIPGTVIIEKRTAPAGGVDFGFVITDTQGVTSTFTLSDTERYTVTNAAPGTYVVVEDEFFSGRLANIQCNDANGASPSTVDLATRTANINVSLGETVTCTFTNAEDDFIIIHKSTYPVGGAGFDFTSNIPGGANFTLDHDEEEFFAVTSGTYTITETNPGPLWELGAIDCTVLAADPNDPPTSVSGDLQTGSVTLDMPDPGQLAYCVFTNLGLSSITIEKDAQPAEDIDFDFVIADTQGITEPFTLNGAGPISITTALISGGIYTITEAATSGWVLDGINCQSTSGNSFADVDLTTGQLVLDLDEGDDVTCTFTNKKRGSITIVKDADPDDGTQFVFDQDIDASGPFTLTHAMTKTFSSVAPAQYRISETLPSGWYMSRVLCVAASGNDVTTGIDYLNNFFTLQLEPGEDVTCTVSNKLYATLTIAKEAIGGDGTFTFTSPFFPVNSFDLTTVGGMAQRTFGELPSNITYSVNETPTPGWVLTDASCDNGDTPDAVFLAPGDDVTCTFRNAALSIVMTKTVGTEPAVCAATDSIAVPEGTDVYYCYTVTNTGGITLPLHSLVDDQLGTLLDDFPFDLAPGATVSTVDAGAVISITATSSVTNTAMWTAFISPTVTASYTDTATVMVMPPTAVTLRRLGATQSGPALAWPVATALLAAALAGAALYWRRRAA